MRELREHLRGSSTAVVRPLTLLGTAGVGKTAIALEYVHRFMNDYDLVCWIPCGQSEEVDLRVAEILPALQDRFGVSAPTESTVAERAKTVLDVLADGGTVPRWLLVYDNAEDIDAVREYLPSGGGQVLITSQNQGWEDCNVRPMRVRLFDREESLAHLLRVVPSLTTDEADELAEALGDLPVAITAVAAYLRDSGYPVSRYLSDLERQQPSAPSRRRAQRLPERGGGGLGRAAEAPEGTVRGRGAPAPAVLGHGSRRRVGPGIQPCDGGGPRAIRPGPGRTADHGADRAGGEQAEPAHAGLRHEADHRPPGGADGRQEPDVGRGGRRGPGPSPADPARRPSEA